MKIRRKIEIIIVVGTAILLTSQLKVLINETKQIAMQIIQQQEQHIIVIESTTKPNATTDLEHYGHNLTNYSSSSTVISSSSSVSVLSSSSPLRQQRVLLLPAEYKEITSETKHIFLDGIRKSNKLELTTNIKDKSSHWFVDVHRCDAVELEQNLEKSGRQKLIMKTKDDDSNNTTSSNNTTLITTALLNNNNNSDTKAATKIFLVDYSDYGFDDDDLIKLFDLSSSFFGRGNVYYATRQHVDDRKIKIKKGIQYENETFHNMGVVWNTRNWNIGIDHGLGGRVKAVRYCVRSDTVKQLQSVLTAQNESFSNILYRSRPKDVASFWNASHDVEPGRTSKSTLRAAVSRMLLRIQQESIKNIYVTAELVGGRSHAGRDTVTDEYSKALIDHKIIVVAQRDKWEGHYRLMEALAGGALVMTDPMHPLPYMLEDGDGLVVYNSLLDLKEKVLYYIQNTEERIKIASRGHNIAMNYHRSWHVMERIILGNWSIDNLH